MTGFWIGVGVSIITGALVNEFCDVSPWLALRVSRLAARVWSGGDRGSAAAYEQEWKAVIADCPGKLFKLFNALWFLVGAVRQAQGRRLFQGRAWLQANAAVLNSAFRIVGWLGGGIVLIFIGIKDGDVSLELIGAGAGAFGAGEVWTLIYVARHPSSPRRKSPDRQTTA